MIDALMWNRSTSLGEIVFLNPSWAMTVGIVGAVLVLLTLVSYFKSPMTLGLRCIAISMRLLGAGLILLCLLEPAGTYERPKSQSNVFAVLIDDSKSVQALFESMGRKDSDSKGLEWFKKSMNEESNWIRKLSDDFRVRRYFFDETTKPVDSIADWSGTGNASSLHQALASIQDRYRGRPLAGVILVSDGQSTDKSSASLEQLGFPVYPVTFDRNADLKDMRIESTSIRQSDFETAPVTLQANLSHRGFEKQQVAVDLVSADAKIVQTQRAILKKDDETSSVEFRFRPEKPGVSCYRLVLREDKDPKSEGGAGTFELTKVNNERFQVIDRGMGPYRVFYLSGRPNWEFKFLKRSLDEDDEIRLTSLIRIARKEPKFSFRNSKVDASNPLFSGFEDISDEEKEQYNEPVYARFGDSEIGKIQKGFPKEAAELFEYSAVIIDDLEHDFLTQDQQSMLRQFVSVRGGALLVLGGQESMRGKGFRNSVLRQLLPVYGEDDSATTPGAEKANAAKEPIRFQLTREGWLQPFMRLADNEKDESKRVDQMPPFEVWNQTSAVKPGASILAEATVSENETVPVFAAQRFGKGRTAALMIGDLWRWGLHYEGPGRSPLFQAWRQTIRWLISDVPKKLQIKSEDLHGNGKSIRVVTDVKGPDFEVVDNAEVELVFVGPDGKSIAAVAQPSNTEVGAYESTFVCDTEGPYTATATVRDADGTNLGSVACGWVYEPSAAEFASVGMNMSVLKSIAEKTGGKVVDADDLESFVTHLPVDKVPIRETKVFPLWHQAWVIVLAIGLLCAEWGLRRRYGMA